MGSVSSVQNDGVVNYSPIYWCLSGHIVVKYYRRGVAVHGILRVSRSTGIIGPILGYGQPEWYVATAFAGSSDLKGKGVQRMLRKNIIMVGD